MPCSPERLAANRRNALQSRGPTSAEGKERSRRNAIKHGLTGAGVALPDEDAAEVDRRLEAFEVDLRPVNEAARFLARRAAVLSVRLDRSVRHESAALTRNILGAEEAEADARLQLVEDLIGGIAADPARAARLLRRSPEGIDRMIGSWEELRADLAGPGEVRWGRAHRDLAENLTGRRPGSLHASRIAALSEVIGDPARREAAVLELGAIVDAAIAGLIEDRDRLDHDAIDRDRAGAAGRALFDASREGVLARKYEAAAEREFYRTLKAIERINEAAADGEANLASEGGYVAMGSFFPEEVDDPIPLVEVADGPVEVASPGPDRRPEEARTAPVPAPAPVPTPIRAPVESRPETYVEFSRVIDGSSGIRPGAG